MFSPFRRQMFLSSDWSMHLQLSKHTVTYPFCIRTCRLSCCSAPLPPNPWVRPWARAGVAARQMFVSTCEFVGPPLLAQVSCASFKVVLFTSLLATQSCVYPPFELLIRVCVCVCELSDDTRLLHLNEVIFARATKFGRHVASYEVFK